MLVTGARGMLGTDLVEALGPCHEVLARDIEDFDIMDRAATVAAVAGAAPDAVVHLAAFADVEACESRRDYAIQCNSEGTLSVALGAKAAGAYMIYLSTDYVFDGAKREPYLESDLVHPINTYGLSKLGGEEQVARTLDNSLVLRTSWLFGPNGRNFIDTVIARAQAGQALRVVNDQRGNPTYTGDLARGIGSVLGRRLRGIAHMTNSGEATWYELAKYAFALAGLKSDIEPVPSAAYPTKAARPAYSVLASSVLGPNGIAPLPHWQDGVRHHLARRGMLKDAPSGQGGRS